MADPKDKPEKQESLPFPPTPSASIAGRTMQESVYKQRVTPRRLPADAPNILIVLIDDAGPALPATFGGEVQTPTMDRIVNEGIAYNRFHTTAMCSPTRASLLTGRNHHRVGNGQIAELANDWDGYSGKIPRSSALVAEVLKDYGYATAAWGKWHNTPAEETTAAGPFENWPTGLGFEYFYGFLAGEASQYEPNLVRNTTYVHPPKTPEEGYHLSEDLADDAIGWLHKHKAFQPDKPFFMYWASGAIHGPHHVAKEWADKYKGKFDDGWDAYRERVFERAKEKGWIPADARAHPAARDDAVLGQHPRGREALPAPLDGSGGGLRRTRRCPGRPGRRRDRQARLWRQYADPLHLGRQRLLGGRPGRHDQRIAGAKRHSQHHRSAYRGARASSAGSTCSARPRPTPCTMRDGPGPAARPTRARSSWPRISAARATRWPSAGRRRSSPMRPRGRSFTTVNDVVPTIYEIIGITPPRTVNGVEQDPIDGVSFAYSFGDPTAKGRLLTQYFEIMGSRAIYHDGWMACAFGPRIPWVPGLPPGIREWTPDKDVWELYNLDEDWSQANDLAAKMPEKLAQMKDIFLIEAAKNKALPIGGGLWIPVLHPELRVAPPYTEWTFASDMVRMPEFCAPALGNKPNVVTIDAVIPDNANGVLVQAGREFRRPDLLRRRRRARATNTTSSSFSAPRSAPRKSCRPAR